VEWKSKNNSRKTRLLINNSYKEKGSKLEPFLFVVKKELKRALSPNKIIKINYSGSTTLSIA
jgi:hypothetical protein